MAKSKSAMLSPLGLGYAAALLAALSMVVISLLAYLGLYTGAASAMMEWHELYDYATLVGVIGGMLEAAIWSFICGAIFAWLYNQMS